VDCYRRVRGNKWELTSYPEELIEERISDSLELMSVNFSCSLSVIYEDVELLPISENFI